MKPVLRIAAFARSPFPGAAACAAASHRPANERLLRACRTGELGGAQDPIVEQLTAIHLHLARARGRN